MKLAPRGRSNALLIVKQASHFLLAYSTNNSQLPMGLKTVRYCCPILGTVSLSSLLCNVIHASAPRFRASVFTPFYHLKTLNCIGSSRVVLHGYYQNAM